MKTTLIAAFFAPALALSIAQATVARADSFSCTTVKLNKQAPVAFRPFPLENPATGEHYLPNQEMTMAGGKKILAKDFFAQVNDLEQKLNAWGYSLRDADVHSLEEIDQCLYLLKTQADVIKAAADKDPPKPWDVDARLKELQDKWSQYKDSVPSLDDLWANADKDSVKVNLPTPPPFTAPVPQAARVEPKDVFKKRTWSFEEGQKEKFWVGGNANVELTGSRETTKLSSDASFSGGLMGMWNDEIAGAKAVAQAGKGQSPQISLEVRLVGQTVWNPTYPDAKSKAGTALGKANDLLHQNDKFSVALDKGVDWRFAIGPVPCKARLGVRGSAGLAYGYDVALTAVGGFAGPFAEADAYLEAGVDIGVAGAGVEGQLLLLKDELTLRGDASITFVDEPKIVLDLSAANDIEALSGRISVYAYVDLFFKKWRGDKKLWDWTGYKDHTDIFHYGYVWTPAGARADGDVTAEDVAEVSQANTALSLASFEQQANQRMYDVMKAAQTDLSSPSVAVVVSEPVRAASVASALDGSVSSYLAQLQKWLGA